VHLASISPSLFFIPFIIFFYFLISLKEKSQTLFFTLINNFISLISQKNSKFKNHFTFVSHQLIFITIKKKKKKKKKSFAKHT
jgi:hypothetical protein